MRSILLGAVGAALALSLVPASAAAEAYCTFANVEQGEDGRVGESCTFTADSGPHGYVAALPNDFIIFNDADGDKVRDPDETVYADVAPTDGDALVAPLTIPTGTVVTVNITNGCVPGAACGWVGALAVK